MIQLGASHVYEIQVRISTADEIVETQEQIKAAPNAATRGPLEASAPQDPRGAAPRECPLGNPFRTVTRLTSRKSLPPPRPNNLTLRSKMAAHG